MLELTVNRTLQRAILSELRLRVGNMAVEEADGDEEDVSFCITEIAEDKYDAVERVLNRYAGYVRWGWR